MQRSKVPEDFLSLAGACWQERTFPMQKFYRLSVNIVKILTLLLAVFLFIGSFPTTCYAENMETQQVLLRFDNPLWNLLELAGYGLLFACCLSLSGKADPLFSAGWQRQFFFLVSADEHAGDLKHGAGADPASGWDAHRLRPHSSCCGRLICIQCCR